MTPDESMWRHVCDLTTGGVLSVSDSSFFYDAPVLPVVNPGMYGVYANVALFQSHPHIIAVKVVTSMSPAMVRGRKWGDVTVDFAQIAICDRADAEAAFDALGDGRMDEYYDKLDNTELYTTITVSETMCDMAIVRTGFGDGAYPVYELRDSEGETSGIEIEFFS
jgi:hypothetical protein